MAAIFSQESSFAENGKKRRLSRSTARRGPYTLFQIEASCSISFQRFLFANSNTSKAFLTKQNEDFFSLGFISENQMHFSKVRCAMKE